MHPGKAMQQDAGLSASGGRQSSNDRPGHRRRWKIQKAKQQFVRCLEKRSAEVSSRWAGQQNIVTVVQQQLITRQYGLSLLPVSFRNTLWIKMLFWPPGCGEAGILCPRKIRRGETRFQVPSHHIRHKHRGPPADRIRTVTLGSNFTVRIFCQVRFCRYKISSLELVFSVVDLDLRAIYQLISAEPCLSRDLHLYRKPWRSVVCENI